MAIRSDQIARSTPEGVDPSVRIDPKTGTSEELEFFGRGPERLFGCRYRPAEAPLGVVVICSSLHAELLNSYRREVMLARALAERGIAVQRFHYRGHGHSDGDSAESTFERMLEDALAAVDRIKEGTGVAVPAFLGTRFGGIIAAAAAARFPGAPLLLWEPVMDGERFFRDAFRAAIIRELKEEKATQRTAGDLLAELRADGVLDVLGYPIDVAFYESAHERTLVQELGDEPRAVFVGQISRSIQPRPEYRRAIEHWKGKGFAVRIEVLKQDEISWFLPNERRLQESRQPLADAGVDWLARMLMSEVMR